MRKKMILLLSVSGLILVSAQSCRKKEEPKPAIQKTINAQLKPNEAYTFVLPENKRDDDYEIRTNASHAKISLLGKDASGNQIYQYTPVLDFTGTDQVIVSNDEELREHHDHHGPPPPHGGCGKGGEEDHYIVTINFTIENPTRVFNSSH